MMLFDWRGAFIHVLHADYIFHVSFEPQTFYIIKYKCITNHAEVKEYNCRISVKDIGVANTILYMPCVYIG